MKTFTYERATDPGAAIAAVAAGVYLVDVRPKILEVQGKSR